MTGAGSADFAFAKEQSLLGSLIGPNFFEPFKDPTITELELDRALQRQRKPDAVFAVESVAQNLEGAFAVEGTVDSNRQSDVHDIVFTDPGGSVALTPGRAPSSRWYIGVDYLSGTAERVPKGCIPLDFQIQYQQGGSIRCAVTFAYADEEYNTSITPSSISEANGASAEFHSADFTVDGTLQSKEESVTFGVSNISRFQRGSDHIPVDAVIGPAEATLDLDTIITETDQLELGYGGSGQSSTSKTMSAVSGSVALSAAGSSITTYNLAGLKPATHAWNDVLSGDTDTTESVSLIAADEQAVSIS